MVLFKGELIPFLILALIIMPHTCDACVTPLEKLNDGLGGKFKFFDENEGLPSKLRRATPLVVEIFKKVSD
jgi:hypothetical protein